MQALIFGLMIPMLPLFIRRLYNKEEQLSLLQLGGRYVVYTLIITLFSNLVMTVMCDNTSFLDKMDQIPSFVLKFVLIEMVAVAVIALVEWRAGTGKFSVAIDKEAYARLGVVRFCRKILFPAGLFLAAGLVVYLNFSLMDDNVVWGDEAYSCNTIRNSTEGILKILTTEENHPPLYYFWLKTFANLFGYTVPVYHLASLVPFGMGILLAVVLLRRRYGNIPAAFFVIISGLAAPCLEYNLEVRMYAMAFLGVAGCYYGAGRVLSGSKIAGWAGMVFWTLVAAYTHYYALVASGILLFVTCAAAYIKYGGRVWLKGVVSIVVCVAAYLPWLGQVLRATESVSTNWWMTEIESVEQSLTMIGGGEGMAKVILPLMLGLVIVLLVWESSMIVITKKHLMTENGRLEEGKDVFQICLSTPSRRNWSDDTYTVVVGLLTIAGTLIFSYGISIVLRPMVTGRYLYPLCAVTAIVLTVGAHGVLERLGGMGENCHPQRYGKAGKGVLLVVLAVLFIIGMRNFETYSATVENEDAKTAEVLSYIGDPDKNTQFLNDGIMHIGWTVLYYYFQGTEIVNGSFEMATADQVWYFTPDLLSEEEIKQVDSIGYSITANYGQVQLGKYEFVLYCFHRKTPGNVTAH